MTMYSLEFPQRNDLLLSLNLYSKISTLGKNKPRDISIKLSTVLVVLVNRKTREPEGNDGTGSISCFTRYESGGIGSRVSSECDT